MTRLEPAPGAVALSRLLDPHETAALRQLGSRPLTVALGRPRHDRALPMVQVWVPIQFRGPFPTGERRWRCANHGGGAVTGSTFAPRLAVQESIRRHMARFHPERDADIEAARVP